MDRVEEAKTMLLSIEESNYKVIHVEANIGFKQVVFIIFIELTEVKRRGHITINISNMAVNNPLFALNDFLRQRTEAAVSILIKRVNQ